MKINIEEVPAENEVIKSNGDSSAYALHADRPASASHTDRNVEVMKLRIALEEKERQYLSLLADFDNLKRRTDRDSRLRVQEEKSELINKILEVIDNFERAIDSAKNYRHDSFFDGILSIYRQLISVLREYRVERIDCLGKEFDPNIHEAVGVIKTSDFDRNTVINEVQKGYIMDAKLLRPSKVHVAV
ncbi:MAG: nucleotide exchange factor GrpE [Thermodesulfobacteriota bacterium]